MAYLRHAIHIFIVFYNNVFLTGRNYDKLVYIQNAI